LKETDHVACRLCFKAFKYTIGSVPGKNHDKPGKCVPIINQLKIVEWVFPTALSSASISNSMVVKKAVTKEAVLWTSLNSRPLNLFRDEGFHGIMNTIIKLARKFRDVSVDKFIPSSQSVRDNTLKAADQCRAGMRENIKTSLVLTMSPSAFSTDNYTNNFTYYTFSLVHAQ
jgi:hypothetical protein